MGNAFWLWFIRPFAELAAALVFSIVCVAVFFAVIWIGRLRKPKAAKGSECREESDGREFEAYAAACARAECDDRRSAEYSTAGGSTATVMVSVCGALYQLRLKRVICDIPVCIQLFKSGFDFIKAFWCICQSLGR